MKSHSLLKLGLSVAAFASAFSVSGEGRYPEKPITIVVTDDPALSSDDIVVRLLLSKYLEKDLGQKIVISNLKSDTAGVGADMVAKAPADGYTLLLGNPATMSLDFVRSAKYPFNPATDLAPVAQVLENRLVLLAGNDAPFENMEQFLEACKKSGADMTLGITDEPAITTFASEVLNEACGRSIKPSSYGRQRVKAWGDLGAGKLTVMFGTLKTVASVGAKYKLKIVGVADRQPLEGRDSKVSIPMYVPGLELTNWYGLFGPSNLPAAVIQRLNLSMNGFYSQSHVPTNTIGVEGGGDSKQMASTLANSIKVHASLVKDYRLSR